MFFCPVVSLALAPPAHEAGRAAGLPASLSRAQALGFSPGLSPHPSPKAGLLLGGVPRSPRQRRGAEGGAPDVWPEAQAYPRQRARPPPPTQVCGSPQADFRVVSNGRFCQKSLVCFVFLLDSREARGSCSRRRDKVTALPCSARSPFQGNASRTAGSVATEGLCSRLSAPLRDLVFLLLSGSKRTSCISNVLVIQGK